MRYPARSGSLFAVQVNVAPHAAEPQSISPTVMVMARLIQKFGLHKVFPALTVRFSLRIHEHALWKAASISHARVRFKMVC